MGATEQHREYVREAINSGFRNPPRPAFQFTVRSLRRDILNDLSAFCDLLKKNFINTFGPDAPGIVYCDQAKEDIEAAIHAQ